MKSAAPTRRLHNISTDDLNRRTGFGFMDGEPFLVKVFFGKEAAPYVRERIWSETQLITDLEEGRIMLEFTARSRLEVISWVLGFGAQAELVEPGDIREAILREIIGLSTCYNSAIKR